MGCCLSGATDITKEKLAMWTQFLRDEGGFIISAELVLVATICVIGLIVGLSEVQHAINAELNDVGDAIGKLNQGFFFSGFHKRDFGGIVHALTFGSIFIDTTDACDCNQCDMSCDAPVLEGPKGIGGNFGGGFGANCAGF
jgi:Flp pilus assembly pilin Flp